MLTLQISRERIEEIVTDSSKRFQIFRPNV